jgi:methionine-rich copper-binding protein CopC
MRRGGFFAAVALFALAGAAQALPPIVIFNYAPPKPALQLVSLKPNNHQEFQTSPESVKASFTEVIDENNSNLKVYDPYNNLIASQGKMTRDTAMEAALPPKLLAGAYRIDWKATCACQEKAVISGTSYFTVY